MKWLFLVYQMQTPDSRERVRVWRFTKKVGTVLYRNSIHVLPYTKECLEDFQWLSQQINDSKGQASIFVSEPRDSKEDKMLRSLFDKSRGEDYAFILKSAQKLLERIRFARTQHRLTLSVLKTLSKEERQLTETFAQIRQIDFFNHPLANKINHTLKQITAHLAEENPQPTSALAPKHYSAKSFEGKLWVTRKNVHIDRLCSAWLIKRFVDHKAKFVFAQESKLPTNAIPFDVFGAEFSHHGEDCTFETLLKAFRLKGKALKAIAEIVHDMDVKDNKFGRPESLGFDIVIRALSNFQNDDHKALEVGSVLLDSLYQYFSSAGKKKKR